MQQHSIETTKTGRVVTYGNPEAKNVWWVLHGYAQLATYFVKNFETLDQENHFVIAPEGLHRFYIKGTSGRVGASWMTKEAREDDIRDYIHFLDRCWDKWCKEGQKHILFGFSQGVATAGRWMAMGKVRPQKFVNWAGVFPPDVQEKFPEKARVIPHIFCIGDKDEYWSLENQEQYIAGLEKQFDHYDVIRFEGSHRIETKALKKLLNLV